MSDGRPPTLLDYGVEPSHERFFYRALWPIGRRVTFAVGVGLLFSGLSGTFSHNADAQARTGIGAAIVSLFTPLPRAAYGEH